MHMSYHITTISIFAGYLLTQCAWTQFSFSVLSMNVGPPAAYLYNHFHIMPIHLSFQLLAHYHASNRIGGVLNISKMDKGKNVIEEQSSHVSDTSQANNPEATDPDVIYISRKSILRQITNKLGAIIRTEGIMKLDSVNRIAWLTLEIPPQKGTKGVVRVETFCGSPCPSDYEAEENVSEVVINRLMSDMNICVNDVSFPAFLQTYRQLHHSLSWSQLLHIKYLTLRIEKDGLFDAHKGLLRCLSSICASYGDILPLAPCAPTTQPPSIYVEPLMYTGGRPPATRLEKLALELFNIIQENTPNGEPIIID